MPERTARGLILAAGLALAACATSTASMKDAAMTTTLPPYPSAPPVVTSGELAPPGDAVKAAQMQMDIKPVAWPLRFKSHRFGAFCYDTQACSILYARFEHGSDKPSVPSSTYGPRYLDHLNGGHLMIRNFPPPAEVTWRSRDGQAHKALIDIGEIFKDELIRHNVPREEMADQPDGEFKNDPSILLEVNDRTIRVYMRVHVPTKHFQKPGNRYSDFRNDLILAKSYTY